MSKTNYLQIAISRLAHTAGPYRCAKSRLRASFDDLVGRAAEYESALRFPSAFAVLRLIRKIEFGRLFDRQVRGTRTSDDSIDIACAALASQVILAP